MIDSEKVQAILSKLQVKMEEDPDILAVILYGSYARGGGSKGCGFMPGFIPR
ncbi:MAG TPA: hypothetical protein PKI66_09320 [Methanobacteriaceae archaeon]|nr:hypothetical protein [Methanobacteriaceae archaeon]